LIAFLIIFFSLLFVFLGVLYFFFSFTFIKHDVGDTDNLDEPVNRPLQDYRETIQKGIDYINFSKCKWVSIQSFDGLTLFARYFDIKSDKTVILMHGYRSSRQEIFLARWRCMKSSDLMCFCVTKEHMEEARDE